MNHWSDFFPLVFFPFKIIVLGIGMYFAIKWHYDQDKKKQEGAEGKHPPVYGPAKTLVQAQRNHCPSL